ncbi:hypothetical protein FBU59_005800, partial [Linderina macrospora]
MALLDLIQSVGIDSLLAQLSELGYTKLTLCALGTLASYKLVYALYLSPLRTIPGPLLARLTSKRNQVLNTIGTINHYALSEYEQYGDIFILEPNAVAICNPVDVRTVLGSHAFLKFHDFYHTVDLLGAPNTFSATDPAFVNMRKRQLGPFFTQSFLNQMEPKILDSGIRSLQSKWDEMLDKSETGSVEIAYSNDFMLATFDIIGALAFGHDFSCLRDNDKEIIDWINAAVMYNGTMATVPMVNYFPFSLLLNPWKQKFAKLAAFCRKAADRRRDLLKRQGGDDKKPVDLLQAYIDAEDPESKVRMNETQITAETIIATVAGTDTSATTLTWTVHLLMNHPE